MSRQNRGSDSELSYAAPLATIAGIMENDLIREGKGDSSRIVGDRRSRGSSDDDEETTHPDDFLNEDFRAGGPSLVPLPAESLALAKNDRMNTLEEHPHRTTIQNILDRCGVNATEYGVVLRQSKEFPQDGQTPTVLIMAPKVKHDKTWLTASLGLYDYLSKQGFPHVSVEIADHRAFRSLVYTPVEKANAMHNAWDKVLECILKEVDLRDCCAVECLRHGYSHDTLGNPPTVLVTVDRQSTRKWKNIREDIVNILKRFALIGVAVKVLKGFIVQARGGIGIQLPATIWSNKAKLGGSIGPNDNKEVSGTFGGYLEIQNSNRIWHKVGITCYHVVLPQLKKDKLHEFGDWHRKGIQVGDQKAKALRPIQPSASDYTEYIQQTKDEISSATNDPDFQRRERLVKRRELHGVALSAQIMDKNQINNLSRSVETAQNFWGNGYAPLGRVFAASGYRTRPATAHRGRVQVDWALIRMPSDRLGKNTINTDGTPKFNLPDETIQPARNLDDDMRVFKMGRSTGWTEGRYNDLKSAHLKVMDQDGNLREEKTLEHSVAGLKGQAFSVEGDSGAFVFDRALALVGMIFSRHSSQNVSYITSCEDLFRDIQQITGAIAVRVPIDQVGEGP